MRCGNIQKAQLVRARRVIEPRLLDRIARILQINEIDPLDHAPIGNVETGNDPGADGHAAARATAIAAFRSSRPS